MPYIIHSSIFLSVFFIFYWLLLRRETFYKLNRWLLVGIILISITLPFIKIPQAWSINSNNIEVITEQIINNTKVYALNTLRNESKEITIDEKSGLTSLTIIEIVWYIYMIGIVIFSVTFLIQLSSLFHRKRKLEYIQDGNCKIFELTGNKPPFSFYKWVFINPALYDNKTYEQIITHEKIHISEAHFIDKLIAELGIIIFWFNPFMWCLRNAIENNLEFYTDNEIINNNVNSESYQMNLLKVSAPQYPLNITTNYNQSILQKRIIMMNLKKSSAKSSWKYLLLIPIIAFSTTSLNATYVPTNENLLLTEKPNSNKVHREVITKKISFSNSTSKNLLSIDNVTGAIQVQGYNGTTIQVEIEKVITADTDEELKRGIEETNVKTIEIDNEKYLYLDSPYSNFDTTNTFSYKNNCDDASCFSYKFQLHYTIKVPFNTNLKLSTINGGDIKVKNVTGNQLSVKHISGAIYLEDVSGTTDAYTISGGITATYVKNPTASSSYVTTSGSINVNYNEDLNAKVTYEIKDGELRTDFDAISLYKKVHKTSMETLKSPVKIGSGNVDLFFKTTSGDVILNKN